MQVPVSASADANCKAATLLQANTVRKQEVLLHTNGLQAPEPSPDLEVTGKGNFYDASGYQAGVWNYDYSQDSGSCAPCTTTNKCGPNCWPNIVSASNRCGGSHQTPINIDSVAALVNPDIAGPTFSAVGGGCSDWAQFVDDHVDEVDFFDGNCHNLTTTFNGVTYALKQFHFHTHSEHTIDGQPADAELHMVHVSANNTILVLGVLLQASELNTPSFMDTFWKASQQGAAAAAYPAAAEYSQLYDVEDSSSPLDPNVQFLPQSKNFYTYPGSLTTVPCSEGVTWIVFEQPVYVSKDDITKLVLAVSQAEYTITLPAYNNANYRPVQPLNDRVVQKYVEMVS